MASEQIPRTSINATRHGGIDIELKSLKLCTRRLQAALTIHATELQILQRLYYKNKNQHRGALFWRNAVEIRRYLERVERLNLLGSANGLRPLFYDAQNVNSTKGPWTHCPDPKTLQKSLTHFENAVNLVEKMADRCLIAYRSFHRSMQSAAFLQILLMFVAIASRTRTLALELKETMDQIKLSITHLISIMTCPNLHQEEKIRDTDATSLPESHSMELDNMPAASATSIVTSQQQLSQLIPTPPVPTCGTPTLKTKDSSRPAVLERTVVQRVRKGPEQALEANSVPKKKKRKTSRDEIDDIFGF